MKLVVKNLENLPFEFVVEPWGSSVEILPNHKLHIIGTGEKYSDSPEITLIELNTLVCTLYCEHVGVYDDTGTLVHDISGHAPQNVLISKS